jgi:hypothetical protein
MLHTALEMPNVIKYQNNAILRCLSKQYLDQDLYAN